MTDAAREQWAAVYSKLSAAQPGLLEEENAKHAEKRMTIQREHDSW
jgi:hypothetical protein